MGPRNGNWGGANWAGGLGMPYFGPPAPPVDSGDECYMNHDNCWGECDSCAASRPACITRCDREIVRCVSSLPSDPAQWPRPPRPGTETDSLIFATGARIYFSSRTVAADVLTAASLGRLKLR
jgi:hypothetical protein